MNLRLTDGHLFIDDNKVLVIVLENGKTIDFPIKDQELIIDNTVITAIGSNNSAVYQKNVISPGSTIVCGGNFKLGDG